MDDIQFNGIDARTGQPLAPPLALADAEATARALLLREEDTPRRTRQLPYGVSVDDLAQTGWALLLPWDAPDEISAALEPLLARRREQAGPLFKTFDVRPNERPAAWQERHGIGPDLDPEILPYYLLLVGDPTQISFELQYHLMVRHCVGRLAMTPAELAAYATSVVRAETTPPARRHGVAYWAPKHDPATTLSADQLITPLYSGGARGSARRPPVELVGATSTLALGDDATRQRLLDIVHGRADDRPALLFTASHGLRFPPGDPHQRSDQGALLCQDWRAGPPARATDYVAADHIADDADVHGLVAFLFACYGAGTPALEAFPNDPAAPQTLADAPFVAALPNRLLAHPRGGALAVVGHVERAWGCSIATPAVSNQIVPFHNFIARTLAGEPVGHALRDMPERAASHSSLLLLALQRKTTHPLQLVQQWLERNDAQNYVLLGDPAARLPALAPR